MIIIGGGSAGLFLASKLSENNNRNKKEQTQTPIVIEEHKSLGLPVQCTGILTDDIFSLIDKKQVKKFTVNNITRTKIFSPTKNVKLKIKSNIIIDNVKFVEYLADKAEKQDVKILTNHRYLSNNGQEIKIKDLSTNKIKTLKNETLIGADGPQSKVAFNNELYGKRKFLLGMQARIKAKDVDKNIIDFYPYIGEYAWSVPENEEILRVGVAVPLDEKKHCEKIFSDFLKKYSGQKLETQAGLIPLHKPKTEIIKQKITKINSNKIENNSKTTILKNKFSVALVGDAALQIKNTTGGGIIPGLKAANELSKGLEFYKSNLRNLNKELYVHYLLNKMLHKYTPKDWDRLIGKIDNEEIKHSLESINRDNATKLLLSLSTKKGMISEGMIAATKLLSK